MARGAPVCSDTLRGPAGEGKVAIHADGKSAAEPLGVRVRRPTRSVLREYAESLIIAVLLALAIRGFVVQAFVIPSGSMLPTLQIGDYVPVNKFLYAFRPIRRGDIIVFKFPQDESRDFIKRVISVTAGAVKG